MTRSDGIRGVCCIAGLEADPPGEQVGQAGHRGDAEHPGQRCGVDDAVRQVRPDQDDIAAGTGEGGRQVRRDQGGGGAPGRPGDDDDLVVAPEAGEHLVAEPVEDPPARAVRLEHVVEARGGALVQGGEDGDPAALADVGGGADPAVEAVPGERQQQAEQQSHHRAGGEVQVGVRADRFLGQPGVADDVAGADGRGGQHVELAGDRVELVLGVAALALQVGALRAALLGLGPAGC